jgi:hypothetical protein
MENHLDRVGKDTRIAVRAGRGKRGKRIAGKGM